MLASIELIQPNYSLLYLHCDECLLAIVLLAGYSSPRFDVVTDGGTVNLRGNSYNQLRLSYTVTTLGDVTTQGAFVRRKYGTLKEGLSKC